MKKIIRHELFIFFGILMVVGTFLKLSGYVNVDSDWFWFLAGLALVVEGSLNFFRQKQFDQKFRVVSQKEYELIKKN